MDSYNSSANFSLGGDDDSQLLDLSEVLPSDSSRSRPDDDLSLGDLSLDQTIRMPAPFSLLSQPQEAPSRQREEQKRKGKATASSRLIDPEDDPDTTARWNELAEGSSAQLEHREGEGDEGREGQDEYEEAEEVREEARRRAEKIREDKLQSDIFILKKLNAAFEQFNGALDEAGSANHVRLTLIIGPMERGLTREESCRAVGRDGYVTQQVCSDTIKERGLCSVDLR